MIKEEKKAVYEQLHLLFFDSSGIKKLMNRITALPFSEKNQTPLSLNPQSLEQME